MLDDGSLKVMGGPRGNLVLVFISRSQQGGISRGGVPCPLEKTGPKCTCGYEDSLQLAPRGGKEERVGSGNNNILKQGAGNFSGSCTKLF